MDYGKSARSSLIAVCLMVVFCSRAYSQDEQSLAYHVIRFDSSSELYFSKAKKLVDDVIIAKETKQAVSTPEQRSTFAPEATDFTSRDLGEDHGSGGVAEWRVEQAYVAALDARSALIGLLEFIVKHPKAWEDERTISMNMLIGNSQRRLEKADELMKNQSGHVRSEMESCADKIGAVPQWESNNKKYEAAVVHANNTIEELSKLLSK
jgi:hypothetical protein